MSKLLITIRDVLTDDDLDGIMGAAIIIDSIKGKELRTKDGELIIREDKNLAFDIPSNPIGSCDIRKYPRKAEAVKAFLIELSVENFIPINTIRIDHHNENGYGTLEYYDSNSGVIFSKICRRTMHSVASAIKEFFDIDLNKHVRHAIK